MRIKLAALLTGQLLTMGCDMSSCSARQERSDEPVVLAVTDGPFSVDQLRTIAYHYHPRMAHLTFETAARLSQYVARTRERRALLAAHELAVSRAEPWRQLVDELRTTLPSCHVVDRTAWQMLEPAFVVMIESRQRPHTRVVGMVSFLAPIYYIYESTDEGIVDLPGPRARPLADALERIILKRYQYHRLEHEAAATILPEIHVGDQWFGETTILDALFTSVRW